MGLEKATITNLDTQDKIKVLFNPTEYTIAKQNQWQAKPIVGKNVPKMEFTSGGSKTMTFELFLDVFEEDKGDVRTHVNKLWDLTMINEKNKDKKTNRSRPPLCLFQWGPDWQFQAAVTSLSVRYTLFRLDGTPARATASITLQEATDDKDQPKTNPTSGSMPGYRRCQVGVHDTLPLIAHREYGDSTQWRSIAQANDLDDPNAIEAGMVLSIPPLS
jgi:hypothetical protein